MKIKKISYIGKQDVYNMEVEGYHNYILDNGMVIKNCDAIRYFVAGRPYPSVEPENRKDGWDYSGVGDCDYDNGAMNSFLSYGH